jgi:hypothetical protein
MKLEGNNGSLELESSELPGTQRDDDVLLNVSVKARGYSAADQSWVVGSDWSKFPSELVTLEQNRQGLALVEGASPNDFRLEIYSTDSVGHMAARGHVGWRTPDDQLLQLTFGFHFDPDRLPKLLRDLNSL